MPNGYDTRLKAIMDLIDDEDRWSELEAEKAGTPHALRQYYLGRVDGIRLVRVLIKQVLAERR